MYIGIYLFYVIKPGFCRLSHAVHGQKKNDNVEWKVALAGGKKINEEKDKKKPYSGRVSSSDKGTSFAISPPPPYTPQQCVLYTAYKTCNQVYIIILYRKFFSCASEGSRGETDDKGDGPGKKTARPRSRQYYNRLSQQQILTSYENFSHPEHVPILGETTRAANDIVYRYTRARVLIESRNNHVLYYVTTVRVTILPLLLLLLLKVVNSTVSMSACKPCIDGTISSNLIG